MVRFDRREILFALLLSATGAAVPSASAGEAEINAIIRSLAPIRGQKRTGGYDQGWDAERPPPREYYGGTRTEPDIEGETIEVVPSRSIDLEVYFEFDSAALTGRTRADLRALGRALASPDLAPYRYLVAGHTDAVGDPDYNLDLSRRRARAVRDYLVTAFPIDPYRLKAVGFGDRRLKRPGKPTAAINRRVEVILILPVARRREPDTGVGPPPPRPDPPCAKSPADDCRSDYVPGAPAGPDGKPSIRW